MSVCGATPRCQDAPVAVICDAVGIEMILSFAWTTEALLAGKKTCTRRIWSERTAGSWIKACQSGRWIHQAWSNAPFVKGASKVADIRLTHLPYQQRLVDMPLDDLEAEGGLWASKEEFISLFGGRPEQIVWVVRFERQQNSRSYRSSGNL